MGDPQQVTWTKEELAKQEKEWKRKVYMERVEVHASQILAGVVMSDEGAYSPKNWMYAPEVVSGAIEWATLLVDEIDRLKEE
jgi:hypothetical protein